MISDLDFHQLGNSHSSNNSEPLELLRCIKGQDAAKRAISRLAERTSSKSQSKITAAVNEILQTVRHEGDKAVVKYTKNFDGFSPEPIKVNPELLEKAWEQTPKDLCAALELAKARIEDFHQRQYPEGFSIKGVHGELLGRRWKPVEKAGIYIPGGRASYPSTVLMNAIPAKVAGVKHLLMASPAGPTGELNQTVLAAAHLTGVNEVIRIGGAQAIAALAFGTETVPKVDVITGPGNIYVTLAKKAVYGQVGLDSLAGPSEVLIIADHTALVEQVAADLLAQAEHDPLASAVLITTEESLAKELPKQLKIQLASHPRKEICQASLQDWGLIVTCDDLESCVELSNQLAPEHLELLVEDPDTLLDKVLHAGAIFMGPWTPEAVGDYLAGPNHTLPTSGTARFSGALSVETFMKSTSLIKFNEKALRETSSAVQQLALSEGLHSHAESVRMRTGY